MVKHSGDAIYRVSFDLSRLFYRVSFNRGNFLSCKRMGYEMHPRTITRRKGVPGKNVRLYIEMQQVPINGCVRSAALRVLLMPFEWFLDIETYLSACVKLN